MPTRVLLQLRPLHLALCLALTALAGGVKAQTTQSDASADTSKSAAPSVHTLQAIVVKANPITVLAPSSAPLDVGQPTSVIDERFIRDSLRLNANYDDIIKYAPSVSVVSPEGPGLGKNEGISIRGFRDGQFNVTFDGIPFGNVSDLHHTTSAYFSNHILGQAEIDRGPGSADTIGNATFGGTVALRTITPSPIAGVTPYLTFGSWNTRAGGVQFDSGTVGNTRATADFSRESSDTYLTYTNDRRDHAFVKSVSQLGAHTELSFVASYNHETQNTAQGATLAEIAQYGPSYGLNDNPQTQGYYRYNPASYYSSFVYAELGTLLGGWRLNDKLYRISFNHHYIEGSDGSSDNPAANGVTLYDASGKKVASYPTDVPGKFAQSRFSGLGNVLRLGRDLGPGTLLTGMWLEHLDGFQMKAPLDLTRGGMPTGSKYGTIYTYNLDNTQDTAQPYLQYDWNIDDAWTLTGGVRYAYLKRELDALYNKSKPPAPLQTSQSYHATLPSLELKYMPGEHWSAYAQVAKGSLAPPINVVETSSSVPLKPEQTTNYQAGYAWQSDRWSLGADVYYIDFSNYISTTEVSTNAGKQEIYVNGGGAIYKGIETELTYALTTQLSLYGNATLNRAQYKNTTVSLAMTPRSTAALGLIYGKGIGYYGSVMAKYVGSQFGVDNSKGVFANAIPIGAYTSVDLAAGYRTLHGPWGSKEMTISIDINNLFNRHNIIGYAGTQDYGDAPLFWSLAGRGVFVDFSIKL